MHLKEDARDYLEPDTLRNLVIKYSQFINFNIFLWASKTEEVEEPIAEEEEEKKPEDDKEKKDDEKKDEDEDAKVEEDKDDKEKKPKTKKVQISFP